MAFQVRRTSYFYVSVRDRPGEAYRILSRLADLGVNLLALTGIPMGPEHTQLTVFPQDEAKFKAAVSGARIAADGPHPALLVQGDDQLGVLADVHERLQDAKVNVYASYGVADGRGWFGYVVYVRPEEYDQAGRALGI